MICRMGRKSIEVGASGQTVAANITRFRGLRGWTLAQLSEQLDIVGRPLTGNTLSAIENCTRRSDTDDLVAIAAALRVSPAALLMPYVDAAMTPDPSDPSLVIEQHVPTSAGTGVEAGQLWDWLIADSPLDASQIMERRDEVAIEMWRREQVPQWAYRTRLQRE